MTHFRGSPSTRPRLYELAFHNALKPLSTLGVDNVPDLMQFLPPPESQDFPGQALGLTILLDQAPRAVFTGVNSRYTYGYFDKLTQKLTRQLFALPPSKRPASMERLMAQGWSYEYAFVARIWLMIPLVHSEHIEDHKLQLAFGEKIRQDIEQRTENTDPYRATMEEDSKDIYGFPRIYMDAPLEPGLQIDKFTFWLLRLTTVHPPLLRKFGRYCYRNTSLGRESTQEEIQYAKDTDNFAMLDDEDAAKKIREDVVAGRWSPLAEEKPGE